MSKISPSDFACDPSTSGGNGRIGILVTMATRMFGVVSRRFDRRMSLQSSVESIETGIPTIPNLPASAAYQQSSTRKLAFAPSSFDRDSSKPTNDFYNNSTLATVSKLFCAIILLTAFLLVMSRSFSNYGDSGDNSYFFF